MGVEAGRVGMSPEFLSALDVRDGLGFSLEARNWVVFSGSLIKANADHWCVSAKRRRI